jgi:Zn-dependent alcohol dehydrogenase
MKTQAAVLFEAGRDWEVLELDLDPPKTNEVLLRVEYCGLCHSDEHVRKGAFLRYPVVGGHEGAGVIEQVGPGVTTVSPGDHAVTAFAPRCGTCPWCMTGRAFLCDKGAAASSGELLDGTFRLHYGNVDVGAMCLLGTFSQWADKAIVITGNVEAGVVTQAVDAVSKAGTVVLTGMSDPTEVPTIQLNGTFMAVYAKRLLTTLYGHCNPHVDIPRLAKLYRNGQLKLDELITARYELADVNKGYRDLLAGENLRGIIEFEH